MKINCDHCDKEFNRKPSRVKRNLLNFCSKQCGIDYRIKNRLRPCSYCGCLFDTGKGKNKCCSRKCAGKLRDSRITLQCDWCGDSYLKHKYKADKNLNNYCSTACSHKSMCKEGTSEFSNPKERRVYRTYLYEVKRTFSLDEQDVRDLQDSQKGCCAICLSSLVAESGDQQYTLHIDHNHSSGKVRGLLCSFCNTALGLFQDESELLRNGADYLDLHNS